MLGRVLIAAVAAWMLALPAQAAWHRAETDRFVVYGEGGPGKVRDYAEKLTKFDATLRIFHPAAKDRPSWTKMQVVLVGDGQDLRRVRPDLKRNVGGVYMASNEGIVAIAVNAVGFGADDVLFHEYAHHFMLENFPVAYPAWYVEGFAEYFAPTEVVSDGVKVGGYNPWRAYSLFNQIWLPWNDIFTKRPFDVPRIQQATFYAQAWLLTHYMHNGGRAAKLDSAIRKIAAGGDPAATFWAETGLDEKTLTRELRRYQKLAMLKVPASALPAAKITVAEMPASYDDLFLDRLRLLFSPPGRQSGDFLAQVRRRAAKHPDDVFAQRTLARAESSLGEIATGEAILQRLQAQHPDDKEVLLDAGWGLIVAGLRERPTREARWRAARPLFGKVYAADKNDFRPMYAYALSRSIEPVFPSDNDLNVLLETRALAPAVQENSLRAGLALLQTGRRDEAAKVLAPLVNNPHGGQGAASARALLAGAGRMDADDFLGIDKEEDADDGAPPGAPTPPAPAQEPSQPAQTSG